MKPFAHRRRSRGAGFTLVEVLVALLVLGTGLIAMANFQARVTTSSIDAKARSEAMQLAQQRMEWLRARDLETLASDTHGPIAFAGRVAEYDLSWTLEDLPWALEDDPQARFIRAATVRVDWVSSRDEDQSVELVSYVANSHTGLNPGSGLQLSEGFVPGPRGGARIKRYDLNDLPNDSVSEFGNIEKLAKNADGNIEFINTQTGEALEILTPHQPAFIAGTVYVRKTGDTRVTLKSDTLTQDVFVRATPISLCGHDAVESDGDFGYYSYRCYIPASNSVDTTKKTFGWYGNIGILHPVAHNNDGVCVGSLTPATAFPSSVRQYRGYETRKEVCENGAEDCGTAVDDEGKPLLFPVGLVGAAGDTKKIEDHNFLVARIGNKPKAQACTTEMQDLPSTLAGAFNNNPPEFYCFSEDPTLCPERTFGVSGPEGCGPIGAVCVASGKSYNGMVYAGASGDFYYFTSVGDEPKRTWSYSATECSSKDRNKGWFLGGVNEVHHYLHSNLEAFATPPDGVDSPDWAQPLAAERYWTRDETKIKGTMEGLYVDIRGGDPGNADKTTQYLSRCLFKVPLPSS